MTKSWSARRNECVCGQRGQSLAFATKADREVVVAETSVSWDRHLMVPVGIYHSFAELRFTIDHWRLRDSRRPRSTRPRANGGKDGREAAGGVSTLYRTKNK
jgi:hypothetical protein